MADPATSLQDLGYPAGFDYHAGSPHLRHPSLNQRLLGIMRGAIDDLFARRTSVRILEVGAGHGSFTDHLLATGAEVTVTEMSRGSAELLERRFRHNPWARVVFDPDGDGAELAGDTFDLVVCVSVLHHIPDYCAAISGWADATAPGGSFVSLQDPLWYPRRSRTSMVADRGAYLAWRVSRGGLVEGTKSLLRRRTGRYDETNPRDMVEYHVVRKGCDEEAITSVLRESFGSVELIRYWSTQAPALQRVGDRLGLRSTFGVVARNKTGDVASG